MIAHMWGRVGFICFLIITIICTVNSGHAISHKAPISDTLKIVGCKEKIKPEVGSIVEIKLKAIPGTGYQWLLKESSQLLVLLDADSLKFSKPDSEPGVGQTGHQILHFKVMKKGEEKILLEYRRTWEKEIAESCVIKIEVN